jgi:hypothetical protein
LGRSLLRATQGSVASSWAPLPFNHSTTRAQQFSNLNHFYYFDRITFFNSALISGYPYCKIIESKVNEIIDKINKQIIFEADPLDSELRILDWILYQVCSDEGGSIKE